MKLLKTNSKQYQNNFKNAINETLLSAENHYCENINDLLLCFNSEVNHINNKKRIPNLQNRLEDYLRGLPYGFSFAYGHEILSFACLVHELKEIPKEKENIIISSFYSHCALMILRLANKNIVNSLY